VQLSEGRRAATKNGEVKKENLIYNGRELNTKKEEQKEKRKRILRCINN
jgi:sulfur transfer protein SufE